MKQRFFWYWLWFMIGGWIAGAAYFEFAIRCNARGGSIARAPLGYRCTK